MKKIIAGLLLSLTIIAPAHAHGFGRGGYRGGFGWVAPAMVGGVIGYEIAQPRPPVIVTQQPPIVIQQPPIVQQTNCSPWTEIRNPDGTVTVTRTCTQ